MAVDNVNHPSHYCNNKAGIEVIEVTGNLNFDLGNAFKYLARYKSKKLPAEDVKKAVFYLNHFYANIQKLCKIVVCTEEEIPALVKKMVRFCDFEDVPCIRRAMETITLAVLAELDYLDHPLPLLSETEWNITLLSETEWNITINDLMTYAESIADKKPEDFNG